MDTDTQEEGHVPTKTEIGVWSPKPRNAEDSWQSPESGRGKEGSSPKAFREHGLANTLILNFWPP